MRTKKARKSETGREMLWRNRSAAEGGRGGGGEVERQFLGGTTGSHRGRKGETPSLYGGVAAKEGDEESPRSQTDSCRSSWKVRRKSLKLCIQEAGEVGEEEGNIRECARYSESRNERGEKRHEGQGKKKLVPGNAHLRRCPKRRERTRAISKIRKSLKTGDRQRSHTQRGNLEKRKSGLSCRGRRRGDEVGKRWSEWAAAGLLKGC